MTNSESKALVNIDKNEISYLFELFSGKLTAEKDIVENKYQKCCNKWEILFGDDIYSIPTLEKEILTFLKSKEIIEEVIEGYERIAVGKKWFGLCTVWDYKPIYKTSVSYASFTYVDLHEIVDYLRIKFNTNITCSKTSRSWMVPNHLSPMEALITIYRTGEDNLVFSCHIDDTYKKDKECFYTNSYRYYKEYTTFLQSLLDTGKSSCMIPVDKYNDLKGILNE